MLPTAVDFSRSMSALGVGDRMTIVIYEQVGVFSAPRAWWMLRTFGVRDVRILDGSLAAWLDGGFPTQTGDIHRTPADFNAKLNQNVVRDFSEIQQLISDHAQILDARSSGRFAGASPEPRPGISSGHMPGATNVPFTELLEEGRLKPAEKLQGLFAAKGVDLNQPITTTCGSGVTAAVVSLGLEIAGARDVSLYDGSWAEYAQRPEATIEKTS
jgi:thiosulfate/3-mercaptopyruvate sulfurtransferase